MTGLPEPAVPDTGACWFGLRRLPSLVRAFENEIAGVKDAEDIEYVHRMRVASRRLRADLSLFYECFPNKQYARWRKEVTAITRALGEARDADVQISFLIKYQKKVTAGNDGTAPLGPAIAFLLREQRKKRRGLQVKVLSALDELERKDVVGEMHATFSRRNALSRHVPVKSLAYGIPTVAAFRIASRLDAMRSFEPFITYADAVAEHHAMRIAAKKLRYTMEAYGPLYRLGLAKPRSRVKKVQEILGDLHDCDVWIDHVTRLLLRERGRLRSSNRNAGPDTATLMSLRLFLRDREAERTRLHRRFMRYWMSLDREGIWDELRRTLVSGRKKRFIPVHEWQEEDLRLVADNLAATFPSELAHHRTVTRIALMLFDQLLPLHGLSRRDRALLECAAMLHDIGLSGGLRGHNIRAAQRIFSSPDLPLDLRDRCAAGLTAFAHRGKANPESHPLFRLSGTEEQRKILLLAAMLRLADGLDTLHTGSVEEIRCDTGGRDVICEVLAQGDVTREKERAQSQADLFTRVFGRGMAIR